MLGFYWTIEWQGDDGMNVLAETRDIMDCMKLIVEESMDPELTILCLKFGYISVHGDTVIVEYAQLKPEWLDIDPRRALMMA